MQQLKKCSRCEMSKDIQEFNRDKRRKDGKRAECKLCHRKEVSAHREANLDRAKENWYRWKNENPARYMLWRAKQHARQAGRESTIEEADIQTPTRCPILGLELDYNAGKHNPNSASLDRIDNSKGYVKGNVITISFRANALKRDASLAELNAIANFYNALDSDHVKDLSL